MAFRCLTNRTTTLVILQNSRILNQFSQLNIQLNQLKYNSKSTYFSIHHYHRTQSSDQFKQSKMSSPDSTTELTNEEKLELFNRKPAYLILRKYETDKIVYAKLQYKYKSLENDEFKIKTNLLSFQRLADEPLQNFIDKMRLGIGKFVLSRKNKPKVKGKKSKTELIEENKTNQSLVNIRLMSDGQNLLNKNLNVEDLFKYEAKDIDFAVDDVVYKVFFNAQFISSCKLPRVILSNFEIFPQVQIDFQTDLQPKYAWSRKISKKDPNYSQFKDAGRIKHGELKLGDQRTYTPTKFDINHELLFKVTSRLNDQMELETYTVESKKVWDSPDYYPYEKRHELTRTKTANDEFRIVTYNILADMYSDSKTAREQLFKYCPEKYLKMDYRKHLILKELIGYNADLICLQECDQSVFQKHLESALKMRSNLNGLMALKSKLEEGCVIFYNDDKFRLIKESSTKISELINKDSFKNLKKIMDDNFQLRGRFEVRPNILQTVALQSKDDPDNLVLLFNTHFYFHPDSDHIRLLHGCLIMKEIEDLINEFSRSYKKVIPIVAGDFNSCPEFGVYKLFTQGRADADLEDWRSCMYFNILKF